MSEINPPRIGVGKTRPMASVTNGTRSGLDLILLQLAHWQKARGSCRRQRLGHLPGRRTIYAVENVVLGDEGHHRQRRSKRADALIAGAYFAGTSMRRVCWALAALFGGAAGKDTVNRVWRKARGDWDAWNGRSLADEPIVRLILDGTVVRVRLDRQKRTISLLVALLPDGDPGVR